MCSTTLTEAVDTVAAVDVGCMNTQELQAHVARVARAAARLEAAATRALGALSARGGGQVADADGVSVPVHAWLRSATGTSIAAAGRAVRVATRAAELPVLLDAASAGEIRPEHLAHATRLVGVIDRERLADNAGHLRTVAELCDPEEFGRFVRHYLATYGPDRFDDEERRAEDHRYAQFVDNHDGTHRLTMRVPSASMETIRTAVEPLARREGDADTRTAGQRRADAMVDLLGLALRHADLPDAGGARPHVTFVVPTTPAPEAECGGRFDGNGSAAPAECDEPDEPRFDAERTSEAERLLTELLTDTPDDLRRIFELDPDAAFHDAAGAQNSAAQSMTGAAAVEQQPGSTLTTPDRPAHGRRCACLDCLRRRLTDRPPRLPGPAEITSARPPGRDLPPAAYVPSSPWTGPQTVTSLATALCDAVLSVLTLDPTGQIRDLTDHGPTVTRAQRRAVTARDRHCTAPGCTRPPAFCDVHHLIALADGGATAIDNLVLLCRRHHVLWHRRRLGLPDLRIPWHPSHRVPSPP